MGFSLQFIQAGNAYNTLQEHVPAPLFRRVFRVEKPLKEVSLTICGLGFYQLYLDGIQLDRGKLCSYISNPDDLLYYDRYEIADGLSTGDHVLAICLGNGLQNSAAGWAWLFDKARWRGAPRVALMLEGTDSEGEAFTLEADQSFRVSDSPILFNDLRCGEIYDARCEQAGWNTLAFDDSKWGFAQKSDPPRGRPVLNGADPVVVGQEILPVAILPQEEGFVYDFGVNTAGVCRLTVSGSAGQTITLEHAETLTEDGVFDPTSVRTLDGWDYLPLDFAQKDTYICSGQGVESYVPAFTYHGFRYVLVKGIAAEQATPSLLTLLEVHSDLKERGGFECADAVANQIQQIVRRSTLANFVFFPTDCPQREKNGWMGDAAVSTEHTLLNLAAENSYKEWLRNIRRAQDDNGTLSGIVPTAGWGYEWGNGPAWDSALFYMCDEVYRYRGDTEILRDNAACMMRYLDFLTHRVREDGLIAFGLGDWCPVGRGSSEYKSPLEFTDTVLSMDNCNRAARAFRALGYSLQEGFAESFRDKLRAAIRAKLVDFSTMTVAGNCQTSQAMALYYGVFDPPEREAAFARLLEFVREADNHMDVGILGNRVLFDVLSEFGYTELAFRMITRPDWPSFGNLIARGATSLWESFQKKGVLPGSYNHHFFGDVSGWFIRSLAGIVLNPHRDDVSCVYWRPGIIRSLPYAQAFHTAPAGTIRVRWEWEHSCVRLNATIPEGMHGKIILPTGYRFEDGTTEKDIQGGDYSLLVTVTDN